MPAIDQCEFQIINALRKEGWSVTHQPFAIRVDRNRVGYIYADLRLREQQNQRSIIIVEVKCFSSAWRLLDELYRAIGQYVVYRNALAMNYLFTPVYLAVSSVVNDTFFQRTLIRSVLSDIQVKLIVVDLEREEVIQWNP